jgi:hypothetical protein
MPATKSMTARGTSSRAARRRFRPRHSAHPPCLTRFFFLSFSFFFFFVPRAGAQGHGEARPQGCPRRQPRHHPQVKERMLLEKEKKKKKKKKEKR